MRAYVLIAGSFTDLGGTKYVKGQVVWSDLPLIKSFPGKFRRATQQEIQEGKVALPEETERGDDGEDSQFFAGRPQQPQPLPGNQDVPPNLGNDLTTPGVEVEGADEEDEEGSSTDSGGAPRDVTEDFPKAEKHGLKVVRDMDGYRVLGEDDTEVHEPFKTERGLNNFLSEYGKKK